LFLGALNFQLVRRGEASSILSSLKRFGEAEIGIGVTVILAAASLTSLPPAADLTQDRVSGAEIYAHDSASAASLKSCQERSARRSLCRPKKGLRDGIAFHGLFCPRAIRRVPQHSRREGLVRVQPSLGGDHRSFRRFLAVLAQTRRISWVSNWPLLFLGLSIFLFLRSDPGRLAARPKRLLGHVCGSRGLVAPHLCGAGHRLAVFEWRVQTGRVASANIRLVFPMLIAVSGALLLTHSHSLGNVKEEVLAELSHIPLAILAVMAGWSRWLELRLPAENHTRAWSTRLWPVRISLIGILLLNYREM
jgi:copper resistance protein D